MEGLPSEFDRHRDPAMLRISDDDRHQVAELLRQAAGEGRIDIDELGERLEATYAAKTYADLVPITADLPVRTPGASPVAVPPSVRHTPMVPATAYASSMSVMGDCTRRGVWRVPQQHTAFTVMGGVTLDLREALFEARETVIHCYAIMGGINVIVNANTQVVVDGIGVMGDFSQSRDKVPAEIGVGSPVVRLTGLALMAGVSVQRKAMPGEPRKRLGR